MAAGARLIDSMYLAGAGTAAASGTVNFYGVGTLVPAVVYADDTLSTPLTQPITLDASGKLPSPVYTATPLRMIVKSSAGTTLYDVARIDGDRAELVGVSNAAWTATDLNSVLTAVQSSLGGTDARFLAPAKFAEVQLSVKDFQESLRLVPIGALAWDPQVFGQLSNNGQVFGEGARSHKIAATFRQLATALGAKASGDRGSGGGGGGGDKALLGWLKKKPKKQAS